MYGVPLVRTQPLSAYPQFVEDRAPCAGPVIGRTANRPAEPIKDAQRDDVVVIGLAGASEEEDDEPDHNFGTSKGGSDSDDEEAEGGTETLLFGGTHENWEDNNIEETKLGRARWCSDRQKWCAFTQRRIPMLTRPTGPFCKGKRDRCPNAVTDHNCAPHN